MGIFSVEQRFGIADLTTVDTTARCPVGTIVRAKDDTINDVGEYVYAQAGAAITVGQVSIIDLTNKCILADSDLHGNSGKPVGFPVADALADTEYGWFKISGKIKAKAGTVAADGKVMLSATGGTVDDAAVAGNQVLGAEFATADGTPAAGFAYIHANRPHVQSQIT